MPRSRVRFSVRFARSGAVLATVAVLGPAFAVPPFATSKLGSFCWLNGGWNKQGVETGVNGIPENYQFLLVDSNQSHSVNG